MNVHAIYVMSSGTKASHEADPLLQQYISAVCNDVDAAPDKTIGMIVGEVCALARFYDSVNQPYVVIINAFLEWEWEGVEEGSTWNPSTDELRILLGDSAAPQGSSPLRRLKSLGLMWKVWEHLRGKTTILVTTDGVVLTRRSERALETAFSAGRACRMYNWKDDPLLLADLVTGTAGASV